MKRLAAALGLTLLGTLGQTLAAELRVGVFENRPIVFQSDNGTWQGLALDILWIVAGAEKWQLSFRPCAWNRCLGQLERGELDLLVGIAWSAQRARRLDFNRVPLLSNWGVVYRRRDVPIDSLLDLRDRRVALTRGSIHSQAFDKLLSGFGVNWTPLPLDNYGQALEAVHTGAAEAAVVNRVFGALNAPRYDVVNTGVIFNPIEIHYAAPRGRGQPWLSAIDAHLSLLKANENSRYYQTLDRWLSMPGSYYTPRWLLWSLLVGGMGLITVLLLAAVLRHQVRVRTAELEDQSRRLAREVAERRRAERDLNRLAFYDSLTGLPNRVLFRERLAHACAEALRHRSRVALLFLDMDRFKAVNDSHGHSVGDELIAALARRLWPLVREVDTLSRMGGDEFTLIMTEVGDPDAPARLAERLQSVCRGPFHIGGGDVFLSLSIGIALFPEDAETLDDLLRHADAAMYQAKAHGGGHYCFYQRDMTHRVSQRLALETELHRALRNDELQLHYQPQVQLASQRVVGLEALLRWEHPSLGRVSPEVFIPVAEETGLIADIGDWVLEQACRELAALNATLSVPLRVAVNVSSRQFQGGRLIRVVERVLADSGLPPGCLELEITEGVFLEEHLDARYTLESLRELGVAVAIDDFGTGYSCLGYLKRLPVNVLKIDRSFVQDLPQDRGDARLASTIISMAHAFGLSVVAEGIETEAQQDYLQAQGCDLGQGYYFAAPQPLDALGPLLREQYPARGWFRGIGI